LEISVGRPEDLGEDEIGDSSPNRKFPAAVHALEARIVSFHNRVGTTVELPAAGRAADDLE
jgi:hypothetical protein